MENVKKELSWIGQALVWMGSFTLFPPSLDKAKHQLAGVYMALVGIMFQSYFSLFITLGAIVLVSIGYEIYQKIFKKGTPEAMDAIRTIVGGLAVLFCNLVHLTIIGEV